MSKRFITPPARQKLGSAASVMFWRLLMYFTKPSVFLFSDTRPTPTFSACFGK